MQRKDIVLFFLGVEKKWHALLREHTNWILGVERKELIEPEFSHHLELSVFLKTSGVWKWLSMVNISLIPILLYALMSTCDPVWFKSFHHE